MSLHPSPDFTSVLAEARQLYVGIAAKRGPHVTPELYAWSDGRLWFACATTTVKAKVLANGVRVAGAVAGRNRVALIEGPVRVFDLRHPLELPRGWDLPRAAFALGSFGLRNGGDLIGFARDALSGALPSRVPDLRVLVAIEPDRAAYVENDRVRWQEGWPDPKLGDAGGELPMGGQSAVVAFPGPHALPARWFAEDHKVFIAPDLLALVGVDGTTPAALVIDEYNAPGPAAKEGVLLRGEGVLARDGWMTFTPERTVEWEDTTRAS